MRKVGLVQPACGQSMGRCLPAAPFSLCAEHVRQLGGEAAIEGKRYAGADADVRARL